MSYPLTLNGNTYVSSDFTTPGYNRKLGQFLFDLKAEMERSDVHYSTDHVSPDTVESSKTLNMDYEVPTPIGSPILVVGYTPNHGPSFFVHGLLTGKSSSSVTLEITGTFLYPYVDGSELIGQWALVPNAMTTSPDMEPSSRESLLDLYLPPGNQREFQEDFIGYLESAHAGAYDPNVLGSDEWPTNLHRRHDDWLTAPERPIVGGWPMDLGCYLDASISTRGHVPQSEGPNHHPGVAVLSASQYQATAVLALFSHTRNHNTTGVMRTCIRIPKPTKQSPVSLVSVGYMSAYYPHDTDYGVDAFLPSTDLPINKPYAGPALKILTDRDNSHPTTFFTFAYLPGAIPKLPFLMEYERWYTVEVIPDFPNEKATLNIFHAGVLVFSVDTPIPDIGDPPFGGYRFTPHVCHQVVAAGSVPMEVYVDFFESVVDLTVGEAPIPE